MKLLEITNKTIKNQKTDRSRSHGTKYRKCMLMCSICKNFTNLLKKNGIVRKNIRRISIVRLLLSF